MPVAKSPLEYVFEGIWTNWSKGSVLGLTLTVSPYTASIVSPALALYISIAGAQLWGLFQYALHQTRASARPQSLLYHQQQVILRNTRTDLNGLWQLIRTAIAWRHQGDARVLRFTLPLALWTFLHICVIVLAGLFSSWLLETGDQVLSRSPWCGEFREDYAYRVMATDINDTSQMMLAMDFGTYRRSRWTAVQQRVAMCEAAGMVDCSSYQASSLPFNASILPGGCPLDKAVCHPDSPGSLRFDTGYLSSSAMVGYNAKPKDRVSIRMVAECSPLNDAKYATNWEDAPATENLPAHRVASAFYGPTLFNDRNATYSITDQKLECDEVVNTPPYSLTSQFAQPGGTIDDNTASFNPITELQLTEAHLSLITASFRSAYVAPVSDPWLSARQPYNNTDMLCLGQEREVYIRDVPLTTMACAQQWQICNTDGSKLPRGDQCSPLLGGLQLLMLLAETSPTSPQLSTQQLATAIDLLTVAADSNIFYAVKELAQSASTDALGNLALMGQTLLPQLPADQWQTEATHWIKLVLTYFQQTVVDRSTGQFASDTAYINVTKPSKTDEMENAYYKLCRNTMVRSKAYRNFSFFALVFTIVICTIIIVLGLTIEDIIGYVRQRNLRYSGVNGKQDMWIANGDLEMLKTIDETKNGSTWTRSKNGVPVTSVGHKVSVKDLMSEGHYVKEGVGVFSASVKRQQTAFDLMKQNRSTFQSQGQMHQRSGTCSTLDISSPSKLNLHEVAVEKGLHSHTTSESELEYHNTFRRGFDRSMPGNAAATVLPRSHKEGLPTTVLVQGMKQSGQPDQYHPVEDYSSSGTPGSEYENPLEAHGYAPSFYVTGNMRDLQPKTPSSRQVYQPLASETQTVPGRPVLGHGGGGGGKRTQRTSQFWNSLAWKRESSGYVQ